MGHLIKQNGCFRNITRKMKKQNTKRSLTVNKPYRSSIKIIDLNYFFSRNEALLVKQSSLPRKRSIFDSSHFQGYIQLTLLMYVPISYSSIHTSIRIRDPSLIYTSIHLRVHTSREHLVGSITTRLTSCLTGLEMCLCAGCTEFGTA